MIQWYSVPGGRSAFVIQIGGVSAAAFQLWRALMDNWWRLCNNEPSEPVVREWWGSRGGEGKGEITRSKRQRHRDGGRRGNIVGAGGLLDSASVSDHSSFGLVSRSFGECGFVSVLNEYNICFTCVHVTFAINKLYNMLNLYGFSCLVTPKWLYPTRLGGWENSQF